MYPEPSLGERIDSFALVSYIPEPLASFLDHLRQDLVPNCFLRAHVTILPPRPSLASPDTAWCELRGELPRFRPFDVTMNSVEIFPVSDVIYISISKGERELRHMHRILNRGALHYKEAFAYHPHITLAQKLKLDEVDELARVARRRWAEFPAKKDFRVETVTFVQATRHGAWVDLAEMRLPDGVPGPLVAVGDVPVMHRS